LRLQSDGGVRVQKASVPAVRGKARSMLGVEKLRPVPGTLVPPGVHVVGCSR